MTKTCKKCGVEKPLAEFSTTSSYKGKRHHRCDCRECNSKQAKIWRDKDPEKHRLIARAWKDRNPQKVIDNKRWHQYRIRPGEYEQLLINQKGKCAVCEVDLKFPHIDHDHKTMKIRGILCSSCNTGIGKLGDSIEGLQKAIEYLKKVG